MMMMQQDVCNENLIFLFLNQNIWELNQNIWELNETMGKKIFTILGWKFLCI